MLFDIEALDSAAQVIFKLDLHRLLIKLHGVSADSLNEMRVDFSWLLRLVFDYC